jgi:hypothetical protein
MMAEDPLVRLPELAGRQRESWHALAELAPSLGERCLLVGGQMVFLHEVERGADETRPTDDIDVVVDLRVEPTGLARVHRVLINAGFEQVVPSPDGIAHRYTRHGATIDVLAPDNLGPRAQLRLGGGRTIEAPGTSQALARSELIRVEISPGEPAVQLRRPTLVGALLGKIAAATEIVSQSAAAHAKHVSDVDSLARLLGPDDRDTSMLTKKERAALERVASFPDLSALARASIALLADT